MLNLTQNILLYTNARPRAPFSHSVSFPRENMLSNISLTCNPACDLREEEDLGTRRGAPEKLENVRAQQIRRISHSPLRADVSFTCS